MSEESLLNCHIKKLCAELVEDIVKDESKTNDLMYPRPYISGLTENQLFQAKLDEAISAVVATGKTDEYLDLIKLLLIKVAKSRIEEDRMM